jgi:RNA polymerase sigma-70 factor (ECF subfamily)
VVEALYQQHRPKLESFLWGVLGDHQAVQDVLQIAFVRLADQGHTVALTSQRAWLFRVAFHEAIALRRKQSTSQRVLNKLAASPPSEPVSPGETLMRQETVEAVRRALSELPEEQRLVVSMRIYEDKTFSQIAKELNIPLGTALWRMRAALNKLRKASFTN